MTALTKYERLESPGLWRADKDAQRKNVVVSLGDATLTISTAAGTALAHWSLPATRRLNPGETPATYAPGPDSDEELELEDDELVKALDTVHAVIRKRGPHKGRLRHVLTAGLFLSLAGLTFFWLPEALVSYTAGVVPEATRQSVGQRLEERIYRVAGQACDEPRGTATLQSLGRTLLGNRAPRLAVLPNATRIALHLPGPIILLNRDLVEKQDSPFALAGFILAEDEDARQIDPMQTLLRHAGVAATIKLLTTGTLQDTVLDRYAEFLLTTDHAPLPAHDLLERFASAGIPASPYAFVQDPTGETTLPLIEADPVPLAVAQSPLSDGAWISLQGICDG